MAALAWGLLVLLATDRGAWLGFQGYFWGPAWPLFGDLEVVRKGVRAWEGGIDPLTAPVSAGLLYNYPRVWLWLGSPLLKMPLVAEGLILAALLIAGLGAVLRPRDFWGTVVFGLVLFSPPVRFVLERGNIDIVVFVLVTAGVCWGARARPPLGAGLRVLAAMAAAILKLYPVAVLVLGIFAERRVGRRLFFVGTAAVALFFFSRLGELELISHRTPRSHLAAYGAAVFWERSGMPANPVADRKALAAYLHRQRTRCSEIFAVTLAAAVSAGILGRSRFPSQDDTAAAWSFFYSGGAIYCGTFLLGNNWSYRLIFLIFCLPFLLAVAGRRGGDATWAWLTLAALGITLLAPLEPEAGAFLLVQGVNWLLGLLLAAGIAAYVFSPASGRLVRHGDA
jgi:Glycosyltransferase family 87